MADECKLRNFPFAGHLPDAIPPLEAARAGQRSIEHLDNLLLLCSTVEGMLRKNLLSGQFIWPGFMLDTHDEAAAQLMFAAFRKYEVWQCPTLIIHRASLPDAYSGETNHHSVFMPLKIPG